MIIVASHRDAHAGSSGGFHCTLGAASFDKQLHSHCVIFPIIITGKVALHVSDPEASADSDYLNLLRYLSFFLNNGRHLADPSKSNAFYCALHVTMGRVL